MSVTFKFDDKLNILGNIINKHRTKNKMSVEQLSSKLSLLGINLTADSIYQIENNTRSIKDYELASLSYILKFSVDEEFKEFLNLITK